MVTGLTGYVGSHVARQLLAHGYKVRGTVRNISDEAKNEKLKTQITEGQANKQLEIVEADLLKEDSWPSVVAGCQYVCHVASPFPLNIPSNEDEIIKPAVEGTLAVLKAASNDGGVKRVVLTSSLAALHDVKIFNGKTGEEQLNKMYNEEDWVDPDKVEPYSKSKILAEKAAWKFIEELPQGDKPKLELAVINPSYVLGPMITDTLSTSVLAIKRLLDKSAPGVPKFNMAICDVRDVALAHVKALKLAEAKDRRYLIVSGCKWMKDVAKVIQKEFKQFGYFVPTIPVPSTLVWLGSFIDRSTAMVVPRLDKEFKLDNKRMVEELKIEPTDIDKTVIETCHSLIEKGIIKSTKRYKKSKEQPATTNGEAVETTAVDTDSTPVEQPPETKEES